MTTTVDHDIDYALRKVLQDALVADGLFVDAGGEAAVQWPNIELDTAPLQQYIRYAFNAAPPVVRELGPTPAMTRKGHIRVDVYVRQGSGDDAVERAHMVVKTAFTYARQITRNATVVTIDIIERAAGVETGAWWMVNINVLFDVWR